MTSYELVVVVHVFSAVLLIGGGLLAAPALHAAMHSAASVSELRRWLTVSRPLDRITPLSSIVLLGTGIYLASTGDWWAAGWVQVAIALWVVNSLIAAVLVRPPEAGFARLVASAEGEAITGDLAAARTSATNAVAPRLLVANDLGVLFLMVVKPAGYLAPLGVILAAHLVVLGAGFLARVTIGRRSVDRIAGIAPGGLELP